MKITFLGTGHGVPSPDRHCSATLVEVGGKRYLIDAGAPVVDIMRTLGVPVDSLSAVFITHRHSDHTFGLPMLVNLTTWFYKNANYDIYLAEQICIDALHLMIRASLDSTADDRVRMHVYGAGEVYSDDTVTVRAIPTNHMNGAHPSYAFVIDCTGEGAGEDRGKRVVFPATCTRGPQPTSRRSFSTSRATCSCASACISDPTLSYRGSTHAPQSAFSSTIIRTRKRTRPRLR